MSTHTFDEPHSQRGFVVPSGTRELAQRLGVAQSTASHWLAGIVGNPGHGYAFAVRDPVVLAKLAVRAAVGERHPGCCGRPSSLVARADRVLEDAVCPEGWVFLSDELDDLVASEADLAELVRANPSVGVSFTVWCGP